MEKDYGCRFGCSFYVSGCGSDTKKADTQLPKKIVIGLDDSFPPMGFKDDKGEIVGLDIDLAKEAAKRAGMDVEFKAIDWSSKEAELKSKKIDVLWNGLTASPEREKNILFSDTYMKDKQYIVVRNDDNAIKGKSDLAGKVEVCNKLVLVNLHYKTILVAKLLKKLNPMLIS